MANSDKNILITPNTGSATLNPTIRFTGANNTPLTLRTLDTGTLSFEGTAGQLFSISDGLSGTIFSVNDISGIPSIEVLDTGLVKISQYNGQAVIGSSAALTSSSVAAMLSMVTRSATTPGLIVRGFTSQSANLQEWQSVTPAIVASVGPAGILTASSFIPTSSTVPSNGMYLSAANTLNFATNTTNRMSIDSTGLVTIPGALTVTGDLTINGTTTNINTTNLVVEDKNVIIGDVTTPSNTTADGGGITLKGGTDKTFNWVNSTSAWTSSEPIIANSFIPSSSTVPTNGMYLSAANTLNFSTNTTANRLTIDSTGNVGIALTTPLAKFHIGSSTTVSDFRMSNSAASTVLNMYTTSNDIVLQNSTATGLLYLGTNGTNRLSINSSGLISISGGALGGTAGNEIILHQIYGTNTNTDYIKTKLKRLTTGADWTTAQATIQRTIDTTDMGYIGFGGTSAYDVRIGSSTTDIAVFEPNIVRFKAALGESVTVSATAAATTVTYDAITNKNVLYYTSNSTANWTFNVRGNASTTLNTLMDIGQSLTVVFMNTNGATPYYSTAFQIDGTAVTPKWVNGTAPSAGNASSIDVYTYNIIKTASATYTVMASLSKFA
jgi:hypothetical protein